MVAATLLFNKEDNAPLFLIILLNGTRGEVVKVFGHQRNNNDIQKKSPTQKRAALFSVLLRLFSD